MIACQLSISAKKYQRSIMLKLHVPCRRIIHLEHLVPHQDTSVFTEPPDIGRLKEARVVEGNVCVVRKCVDSKMCLKRTTRAL